MNLIEKVKLMYPNSIKVQLMNGARMLYFGDDDSTLIQENGKIAIIKHHNNERFDLKTEEEAIELIKRHRVPKLNTGHYQEIKRSLNNE